MPIMQTFKLPNIGTFFCGAKNANQLFLKLPSYFFETS